MNSKYLSGWTKNYRQNVWIGSHLTIISARGTVASSTLLSWRLWMSRTVPRLWAKSPNTEPRCSSPTVTSIDMTGSRTWPPASFRACVQRNRTLVLSIDNPVVYSDDAGSYHGLPSACSGTHRRIPWKEKFLVPCWHFGSVKTHPVKDNLAKDLKVEAGIENNVFQVQLLLK